MRLRKNLDIFLLSLIVSLLTTWWMVSWIVDDTYDRRACSQAYERELARLKTWREEQMAKLDGLSEAKRLEAQLVIDYTMQIAAGKLQGSIMSRNAEECKAFRMRIWPEGIEKIGLWLNGTIEFIMANVRWENAAQADDAAVRIR